MMKWIAPMMNRLQMLSRPRLFAVAGHSPSVSEQPTIGQRLAEKVAAFVGSWAFLGGQATFLVLWLIFKTIALTSGAHFDAYPYILLNLLLSFQAAFTGPVLLIAANVGAIRDHAQSDRIEQLVAQNEKLSEQNAQLARQLVNLEQMVGDHVTASLAAHTAELHEACELIRSVHAAIAMTPAVDGKSAANSSQEPVAVGATLPATTGSAPTTGVQSSSEDTNTATSRTSKRPGQQGKTTRQGR